MPPHGYLGEYIANKWRLPMVIRLSIRYHHFDIRNMETILPSMKPAIQIVSLANQIVIKEKIGYSGDASGGKITADLLEPLNITDTNVTEFIPLIHKEMENVGGFLRNAA